MSKYKIIFVDDEFITLKMFQMEFGERYDVVTASNGDEALKLIGSDPGIQIMFTDYKMPKLSGVELIKKALALNPKLKCSIVTGYASLPEIEDLLNSNDKVDVLDKPINLSKIEGVIEAEFG